MKAQNLRQTVSRAAMPPASIRFSGADGKVLTWMTSSESVHTHSRLLREFPRQPQWSAPPSKIRPGIVVEASPPRERPRSRLAWRATFVTILALLVTFWVAAMVASAHRTR
jgi:hypothetical protein